MGQTLAGHPTENVSPLYTAMRSCFLQ